ncbi:PREDICTED: extensin-like [Chinchilla lanigera]|uniref:extensin-like n=1 Tax=Chinchilla lanigera TaxID=34839 RepID=UPI000697BDDE|nr:PREDICTED: extensin-like [Chinchilla lanigera]
MNRPELEFRESRAELETAFPKPPRQASHTADRKRWQDRSPAPCTRPPSALRPPSSVLRPPSSVLRPPPSALVTLGRDLGPAALRPEGHLLPAAGAAASGSPPAGPRRFPPRGRRLQGCRALPPPCAPPPSATGSHSPACPAPRPAPPGEPRGPGQNRALHPAPPAAAWPLVSFPPTSTACPKPTERVRGRFTLIPGAGSRPPAEPARASAPIPGHARSPPSSRQRGPSQGGGRAARLPAAPLAAPLSPALLLLLPGAFTLQVHPPLLSYRAPPFDASSLPRKQRTKSNSSRLWAVGTRDGHFAAEPAAPPSRHNCLERSPHRDVRPKTKTAGSESPCARRVGCEHRSAWDRPTQICDQETAFLPAGPWDSGGVCHQGRSPRLL